MIHTILIAAAVLVALLALGFLTYMWAMTRAALNGRFGREQQWATELMREDDDFAEAVKGLDEDAITFIANVSVSKHELRENILDAYQQEDDSRKS